MRQPIITLTTDFGLADHFAAAMKGVILGIEPRAQIVDISHEIAPFAIPEAAFVVAETSRCFPLKTVHVIVVDPGVGSARRPILVQASGQYFVAPDNGVLSMIYARNKHQVRFITADRYFRHPVSQTFHGRDVFAPVAAHLAKGVPPSRFGKLISDHMLGDFVKPLRIDDRSWIGRILKVDRFGNLITNFTVAQFPKLEHRGFRMLVGFRRIADLAHCYTEAPPGQLFLIAGSSGYFEIAANQASAAKLTGCTAGTRVDLTMP